MGFLSQGAFGSESGSDDEEIIRIMGGVSVSSDAEECGGEAKDLEKLLKIQRQQQLQLRQHQLQQAELLRQHQLQQADLLRQHQLQQLQQQPAGHLCGLTEEQITQAKLELEQQRQQLQQLQQLQAAEKQ